MTSRTDWSQYGRYEVERPVGGAKDLNARPVRKEERPVLENFDVFVGVVHVELGQAIKCPENQKQPISVTHFQYKFGVTNEKDQELQHFLISRTEGEALEIV